MSFVEKNEDALVSIVVPVYNVQEYIAECLDSILRQTYTNLEIILVLDEGTEDKSCEIAEKYVDDDCRIRKIPISHSSLGVARNVGIEQAKGEWICFVDSDDLIHPEYIETLLGMVIDYHCRTASCSFLTFWDSGDYQQYRNENTNCRLFKDYREYFIYKYQYVERGHNPFACWCNIYHRSLFEKVCFNNLFQGEDSDFTPRIIYAARNQPIAVTDRRLYLYRLREGSILHSAISMNRLDRFLAKKKAMQFWREHNEHEMERLFFPDFFNCMVKDYIELAQAFPERETEFHIIKEELLKNLKHEKYFFSPNIKIHPRSKELWEELNDKKDIIVYGYGKYGQELCVEMEKVGLNIREIWDIKFEEPQIRGNTRLCNANAEKRKDIPILILLENRFVAITVELGLRKMGYNLFWHLQSVIDAITYGKYQTYLPELLNDYMRLV